MSFHSTIKFSFVLSVTVIVAILGILTYPVLYLNGPPASQRHVSNMGLGFLQGFHEDEVLGEFALEPVMRRGYDQAVGLAMLGLAEEAHAIFTLLHSHKLDPPTPMGRAAAVRLFYHVSDLPSPFEHGDIDIGAFQIETLNGNTYHLGDPRPTFDEVTEARFEELQTFAIRLTSQDYANTTTGFTAMQLSQALTALTYMADRLDRQADVEHYMMAMAQRIHANCQAEYFTIPLVAWERMFMTGRLRKVLEVPLPDLKDYADFVLRTLRTRLENGPVHADAVYKDKGIREMLEELDENTMSDKEFNPYDYWFSDEDGGPKTIFKDPATDKEIEEVEEKLGREIPKEMKQLFKISNGCHHVKVGPSFRHMRFVPVQDLYIENDGYMDDYQFSLLPDFKVEASRDETAPVAASENAEDDASREANNAGDNVDTDAGPSEQEGDQNAGRNDVDLEVLWCSKCNGGIAMYEHDGQGTEYTWIIPKIGVEIAKERIKEVYEKVDSRQKARIDEAILHRFGSRKAYEEMDYCIWVQLWGEPSGQKVYPSFMSYLRGVVYDSRPDVERSPIKLSRQDL